MSELIQKGRVDIKSSKLVDDIKTVGFCGAALNNINHNMLSGGGDVVFLVDERLGLVLIMGISKRNRRVVGSSLAIMTLMAVDCAEAMLLKKSDYE